MNRTSLARNYKHKVYPKVKHIRGTTRLKRLFDSLAYVGIPKYEGQPESIFEAGEWDNCFILDACRIDLYNEAFTDAEKRVSVGSSSADYVARTYSKGDFSDVVYVSGNPHTSKEKFKELTGRDPVNVFHEIFQTWDTDWVEGEGRPSTEAIIRDARTAKKLFPDKKLVVHFMKPHHPFENFDVSGFDKPLKGNYKESVWAYGELGEISWDQIWNGYKHNLKNIMNDVIPLANELKGVTVLTSDHGNLVGENGMGHHPGNRNEKPLREVPWVKL